MKTALQVVLLIACILSFISVIDPKTDRIGYLHLLCAISSAVLLMVSYKVL